MLLPRFDYHEPGSVANVCELLSQFKGDGKVLAGGTDLLVNLKKKVFTTANVISVGKIADLKGVDKKNGQVRIGARENVADLAENALVKKTFAALASGAGWLGSPLVRNLATIAGNVVSARPAADLPPSLIAYGAEAVLQKTGGERTVPVESLFTGPGATILAQDELLTAFLLPAPLPNSGAGYQKLGVREALEISLVNVAAFIALDGPDGPIKAARVVLGSVAPTPIRAPSAENALIGEKPSDALFEKAANAASGDSRPIDDFRGSAAYRRAMVGVLTKRALDAALKDARARS
ncbi:FAD binding domain-containing protein [Desulfatiglans anilini]|uniref:FAD binding domain-containing protein n=1 Tax=Desulfatiglans anilini TaxID=90728 RepID=UPI00047FB8AD|nr:xanthine dehydrogenase family protein subunit M [Desulfatiglans anilini]